MDIDLQGEQAISGSIIASIVSESNLFSAWKKVRANRGAPGIDAVPLREYESDLAANLSELARSVLGRTYQPLPARHVEIKKKNGKYRQLGILAVRDRVLQRAVLDRLEPVFEALESESSFAFRPNRNVEGAVREILVSRANGFVWTVESDIRDFFPSINRRLLLDDLRTLFADEELMRLFELWIESGILDETWWSRAGRTLGEAGSIALGAMTDKINEILGQDQSEITDLEPSLGGAFEFGSPIQTKRSAAKMLMKEGIDLAIAYRALIFRAVGLKALGIGGAAAAGLLLAPKVIRALRSRLHPTKGVLQGSPLSPVLANFYLGEFDRRLSLSGSRLVRYCDDFVILCRTQNDAESALDAARRQLALRRLELHPDKTRILSPDDSFEFLGFGFSSDGGAVPPPSATESTIAEIARLSRNARIAVKEAKFRVRKFQVKSWREYFRIFGPHDKEN